mgnify:CR=1 FL=1
MNTIVERFEKIKSKIISLKPPQKVDIIAVSKTFSLEHVKPLVDYGHIHFGENKVQEAKSKWSDVKKINSKIKLHMVGKLQSNKAKDAAQIFDYIHSLDNQKLADIFSNFENSNVKKLKYFIQVNIGNETQKSGIAVNELDSFYSYCVREKKLEVIGLMIIPPNDENSIKYFKIINEINMSFELKELSMGMSADFIDAIKNNSTFVRIGSSIFGSRS